MSISSLPICKKKRKNKWKIALKCEQMWDVINLFEFAADLAGERIRIDYV